MVGTGHFKCMQLNNHSTNNNKPNSNKNTKKTSLTPIMIAAQSCLTLCDPVDYTVHGILWARLLEWVAFPFSRGSS